MTNTVDRAFAIHDSPLISSTPNRHSQVPVELPTTYTRAVAQKSQPAAANTHRHSRSASSNTINSNPYTAPLRTQAERQSFIAASNPSTSSRPSQNSANMQRQGTTGSTSNASLPRRSTSGRSVATNSPSSYVTLMRKQKATVWCDRAQSIDARVVAQQKAAKQRAVLEVVGTNSQRTSTITSGSMVGKIRHGGVAKAPHYTAPNTIGAAVPPRLLAFDMQGEEEQEGRVLGDNNMAAHARSGSGKSSINSGQYRSGYPRAHGTSPEGGSPAHEGIPEAGETPHVEQLKENYFSVSRKSSDEEDSFGELGDMKGPNSKQQALDSKANEEDLRRRGSVDERTTTMTSKQRLFITNPDRD